MHHCHFLLYVAAQQGATYLALHYLTLLCFTLLCFTLQLFTLLFLYSAAQQEAGGDVRHRPHHSVRRRQADQPHARGLPQRDHAARAAHAAPHRATPVAAAGAAGAAEYEGREAHAEHAAARHARHAVAGGHAMHADSYYLLFVLSCAEHAAAWHACHAVALCTLTVITVRTLLC